MDPHPHSTTRDLHTGSAGGTEEPNCTSIDDFLLKRTLEYGLKLKANPPSMLKRHLLITLGPDPEAHLFLPLFKFYDFLSPSSNPFLLRPQFF